MTQYRSWHFSMLLYISALIDLRNDIETLEKRAKIARPIIGNAYLDNAVYEPLFCAILDQIDKDLSIARIELDNAKSRHSERKKRHSDNNSLTALARYEMQ